MAIIKDKQIMVRMQEWKRSPHTFGRNVSKCSHYRNQYDGSSKN
jgi:hypothetical protein